MHKPGNTNTVPLTSCLTYLESTVWQLTIFVFICKTDESKPVKTGGQWYSDTSPFSIPCTNSHPHTHSLFQLTYTYTLSLSFLLSHHTHSLSLYILSLSLRYTHTLSLCRTYTHTVFVSTLTHNISKLTRIVFLSLSNTHTLMYVDTKLVGY